MSNLEFLVAVLISVVVVTLILMNNSDDGFGN